jgi:hypothetical protein
MSAAARTPTAAWERIWTEPSTGKAALAAVWPNAGRESRGSGTGGPSGGRRRRFAGSRSRHALRHRKSRSPRFYPPFLPPRLTSGVAAALPPPTSAGTARPHRQQFPPPAVPARAPGSRPFSEGRSRASTQLLPGRAPDPGRPGWLMSALRDRGELEILSCSRLGTKKRPTSVKERLVLFFGCPGREWT